MKRRAYLDMETTGLSRYECELTVIGVGLERGCIIQVVQLIEDDLYERRLLEALEGVDEIYTYNGSRFDLPFIEAELGLDLKKCFRHTDLMSDCWRQDLKGGLPGRSPGPDQTGFQPVERILGIDRKLKGVDGYVAVRLWWDYVNNNSAEALITLLKYNAEDVANLQVLRMKLGVTP
jgi:hypothetical protein